LTATLRSRLEGSGVHGIHRLILGAAVCAFAVGCASTGEKSADGNVSAAPTAEEYQARLRELVEADLARAREAQGAENAEVVFARPYYYREYFEFPGSPEVYSLDFTEKESRTTPMTAEFEVEKVRFATRPYTKRDEARNDQKFQRSTGIDYVSYELRSGEWHPVGSLFLARVTEENVDGEWKQIEEQRRATGTLIEEPTSWWDKLKFWD
jgi:hypothetical protein